MSLYMCTVSVFQMLELPWRKRRGKKEEKQRKQSWNELFMIVRLTTVSQFAHDVLSVWFRCLSCFGERKKHTETIMKEGIWPWNLSVCISDANLPELSLKDHLKKEVIRQSSFKAASQGRIAAWVLDTAGFEQCNKSRFLSAQPDTAGFEQCNKSRVFYPPRPTLQTSKSAIRVGFYPPGLTLQVNKNRFLSVQPNTAGEQE